MKISDKDIRFTIYAAVFSLVIMGLMHIAVPQPAARPPADATHIAKVKERIIPISTLQIREKLTGNTPLFIMFYTSWCPYCKEALPKVLSLKEKGFFNRARVVFISLDKKKNALAEYLAAEGYDDKFFPYIFKLKERELLIQMMQSKDAHFSGSIPYAAVFDKHGELMAETDQQGSWDAIMEAIKQLNEPKGK